MTPEDRRYLDSVYNSFVEVSTQRVAYTGDLTHYFRITDNEIKAATNRQRLHDSVINDVIGFFGYMNVHANYDGQYGSFEVTLDLSRCSLTAAQSQALSVAMRFYQSEHG